MITHGRQQILPPNMIIGRTQISVASIGREVVFGSFWLSASAQGAILGAFGDDGMAVIMATNAYLNGIAASDRDKATALAGWLNTYAIEDAHIVYSLVPTLGVIRTALNDSGCYARFPSYHTTQDTFIRMRTKVIQASGLYPQMIQLGLPYNKQKCYWLSDMTTIGYSYGGTPYLGIATFDSNPHTFELIYNRFYVDGVLKSTATAGTFENTEPTGGVTICARAEGDRLNREQIEFVQYGEGDGSVITHYIIPYIKDGVSGLMDIGTGDFSEILGSGSFTISETPSTP